MAEGRSEGVSGPPLVVEADGGHRQGLGDLAGMAEARQRNLEHIFLAGVEPCRGYLSGLVPCEGELPGQGASIPAQSVTIGAEPHEPLPGAVVAIPGPTTGGVEHAVDEPSPRALR